MIARHLNYEDTLENKFLKFNQILAARLHFFNYDQALLLPDLAPRFAILATPFLPDFKKSHKSCQILFLNHDQTHLLPDFVSWLDSC
jgi:hypothetical protein